ncbi:MAG: PAS domain-containing protein, partial [Acidobacteria bacterium]|nr:PAS domain-containing protein [Acidobacteriota bacterium]
MPVPLPAQRLERPAFDLRKEAERLILERHSPPAFVVDSELHIIHFQGNTAPYLKPMSGEPSFHLLKILRPELTLEIRTAISDANRELKPVRHEGVRLERDGHGGAIDIEVIPITGRQEKRPDFLVVLHQAPKVVQERGQRGTAGRLRKQQEAEETARLRQELAATQDYLRSLVEDSEATTEELRAANEEILSSNEELQSANEELETAKEELQAGNEELLTLNEELQNRNSELRQALSDVNNLLNWVEIPIVILGRDLRIRRFTAAAGEILNLIPADLGRPLTHIRSDVLLPDLEPLAKSVFEDMRPIEREVADAQGHWYALRMVPYKVQNDKVEGVLVTLVDIDDLKRSYAAVVETMREPLLVLDSSAFRVSTANPAFCEKFREKPSEVENHILFELEQWNIPAIREMLQAATMNREATKTIELDHVFPRIGRKILLFHATPLFRSGIRVHKVLVVIEDMTEQREAEAALRRNE